MNQNGKISIELNFMYLVVDFKFQKNEFSVYITISLYEDFFRNLLNKLNMIAVGEKKGVTPSSVSPGNKVLLLY